MGDDQLRLYRTLSRAPFPKSYVGKVFLTAFLGTHVPLLTLLVYFRATVAPGRRGVRCESSRSRRQPRWEGRR
jgi:hypothetical protein